MKDLRFELSSIVWGENYTNLFLDFLIPNYLSENNLPLARKSFNFLSSILTSPEDAERISAHPHYKKLRETIDCEIHPVVTQSLLKTHNKWGVKGYCQSLAIKRAIANQSIILLLNPDSLISDGGLFKCCSIIESGKKAVVIAELARVEIESIIPDLKPYYDPNAFSLTISNQKLTSLGIQHLHSFSKTQFWHKNPFCKWASIIYWKAGDQSLLAKYFHLHPLAIDLRNVRKKLPPVLMPDDGGLIEFLGIQRSQIHQVTDSNEIVCIELSSKHMENHGLTCNSNKKVSTLLLFSLKYAFSTHISNFLGFNLRFQGTEIVDWRKIEQDAANDLKYIKPVLQIIRIINWFKQNTMNSLKSIARLLGARYLKRKIKRYLYKEA